MLLTVPLIRTITNWGLEQVCREVSPVGRLWMKQALVGQEMYREQDNSHLERPDHTFHTLNIMHDPYNLGLPFFDNISGVRYVGGTVTRYHKYNTDSSRQRASRVRDLACLE